MNTNIWMVDVRTTGILLPCAWSQMQVTINWTSFQDKHPYNTHPSILRVKQLRWVRKNLLEFLKKKTVHFSSRFRTHNLWNPRDLTWNPRDSTYMKSSWVERFGLRLGGLRLDHFSDVFRVCDHLVYIRTWAGKHIVRRILGTSTIHILVFMVRVGPM